MSWEQTSAGQQAYQAGLTAPDASFHPEWEDIQLKAAGPACECHRSLRQARMVTVSRR
jgi:hypothetical protein